MVLALIYGILFQDWKLTPIYKARASSYLEVSMFAKTLRHSKERRRSFIFSIYLLASIFELSIQQMPSFAVSGDTVICTTGSFSFSGDTILKDANRVCTGTAIIPEGVVTLDTDAFRDQAITSVQFPSTLTTIGPSAFLGTSLTTINIPANVLTISQQAFQEIAQLKNVSITGNDSVPTVLGLAVFGKDSLENLTLGVGDGLVKPRNRTLQDLVAVTNLTLGKGLSLLLAQKLQDVPFIIPNVKNGTSVTSFNNYSTISLTDTGFDRLLPSFSLTATTGVAYAGVPFTSGYSVVNSGLAATSYSISPTIGNGLSFNTSTGLISGTPIDTSTVQSYQITGINGNNSATANYSLTINSALPSAPTSLNGSGSDGTAIISFAQEINSSFPITNYKYSLNGGAYEIFSPAITTSPVRIVGLSPGLSYTIRLKAVNSQGESEASNTTSVTPPVSAPAFSLSRSTESGVDGTVIAGYTINSTGGPIASYSISPAIGNGLSFSTTSGLISGTPISPAAAVTYTITGTNASGSSSATYQITVNTSLAAPVFTLNHDSETSTVGIPITGYTISSSGGSIASFSILPTISNGLSFSTVTGLLSGTPIASANATTYTITATNATGSATANYLLTVNAPAPVVVYVPPTPVPYLKTLTNPQIHLSGDKFVCTAGTYNSGYTFDGLIQGSATALYSPASYTFNILFNQVSQTAFSVTAAKNSIAWNASVAPSGTLVSCSVTVSENSLTNVDESTADTLSVGDALSTKSHSVAAATNAYNEAVSANSKSYQKALVDNRAAWRANVDKVRAAYLAELTRINALPASKGNSALKSAALKAYIADQKKTAVDYKASGPAALAVRDLANKAALDTKSAAIVKANSVYGAFIESIGYGVLVP